MRLREWRDLHGQLHAQVAEAGWRLNETAATYEQLHRALLAGLLGNIGSKSEDPGVYLGRTRHQIRHFPGSPLKKKGPPWLMAAELTETTRLYARKVAMIDPAWLERVGAHLIQKTWHDPHWEKARGAGLCFRARDPLWPGGSVAPSRGLRPYRPASRA